MNELELAQVADAVEGVITEQHVPDALMLRRVLRLKDMAREVEKECDVLIRHFSDSAVSARVSLEEP